MNEDIFEVTRRDYQSFVERIIPGKGRVDEQNGFIKLYSKTTGKCLCGRKKSEEEGEKYYIFEYPESDEWGPPIPKVRLTLETKEEVQAFFDALAELRKQNESN